MRKFNTVRMMVVGVLALGAFALCISGMAIAETKYPTGPVRLTVSYSAGGSTDAAARMLVPYLQKELGVSVWVQNLPGAGGEIGWTTLFRSKPDGYTIGFINMPAMNLVTAARDTAYEPILGGFDAVGVNISDPNTIMVKRDDARFNTIKDLIEYAKKHPGELVLGADGPLSDDHLAMYKIEQATGVKFTYVPYDGGAPSAKALMGGETDVLISNSFDAIKFEENLKALAVLWPERYPLIPDVPSFKEQIGIEIVGSSTRGICAPAGVPPGVLAKLKQAFYAATTNPEYIKEATKRGLTLIKPRIGGGFGKMIEDEEKAVGKLLHFFVEAGYIKR